MRRKSSFLLLLALLFGAAIFINVSCKKDKDEEEVCETTNIAGESVKTCCTPSNCYYEWNGKKYHCDGIDCDDAAERLVEDIMGGGKSTGIDKEDLKNEILLLLSDVR